MTTSKPIKDIKSVDTLERSIDKPATVKGCSSSKNPGYSGAHQNNDPASASSQERNEIFNKDVEKKYETATPILERYLYRDHLGIRVLEHSLRTQTIQADNRRRQLIESQERLLVRAENLERLEAEFLDRMRLRWVLYFFFLIMAVFITYGTLLNVAPVYAIIITLPLMVLYVTAVCMNIYSFIRRAQSPESRVLEVVEMELRLLVADGNEKK